MSVVPEKRTMGPAGFAAAGLLLGMTLAVQATAQTPQSAPSRHRLPFTIAAEVGLGGQTVSYDCGLAGYASAGVRLATRGTIFASVGLLGIFYPVAIDDTGCMLPVRSEGNEVIIPGPQGLDLNGAMANVDIGFRSPRKFLIFRPELAFRAGGVIGQNWFESVWMRSLGGVATVAVGRAYVDFEVMHIRTPYWELRVPASEWDGIVWDRPRPEGAATRWNWNQLRSVRFGFRL